MGYKECMAVVLSWAMCDFLCMLFPLAYIHKLIRLGHRPNSESCPGKTNGACPKHLGLGPSGKRVRGYPLGWQVWETVDHGRDPSDHRIECSFVIWVTNRGDKDTVKIKKALARLKESRGRQGEREREVVLKCLQKKRKWDFYWEVQPFFSLHFANLFLHHFWLHLRENMARRRWLSWLLWSLRIQMTPIS